MRILFISNFYPPHDLGGWEQNCQEIVQCLQARGHECYVLTSNYGMRDQRKPEVGIARRLHLQADINHYRPREYFLLTYSREHRNRCTLRVAINQFKPDLVFIWGMWNLSLHVAHWAECWMPHRVAYAVAGYWLTEPDVHETYWRRHARGRLSKAIWTPVRLLALRILTRAKARYPLALDHVAYVSRYVRDKSAAEGRVSDDVRVIYNGIDPRPFSQAGARRSPRNGCLRLIYTGALVRHKGVHTAVEALGLLKERGQATGVSLTLVGGGHPDYERHLRERVTALAVQEHVSFRGRVPREQVADILANHDVFLFTSTYEEPIARSVMEAMAAGLAVIGTAVGGQAEMLEDGMNALVYPPDDASELADRILRLRDQPSLCVKLAQAGRRTVLERFTLERMVNEIEAWLEEIIS